jgi:hypothetical protein
MGAGRTARLVRSTGLAWRGWMRLRWKAAFHGAWNELSCSMAHPARALNLTGLQFANCSS